MLSEPDLPSATVPLTEQIYTVLKNEILDGLWVGRDVFPGEDEVAKRFGVSVITSRRALERLATDGFIERGPRTQRTCNSLSEANTSKRVNRLSPQIHAVQIQGSSARPGCRQCRSMRRVPGSPRLGLWHIRRLRTFEGRPHSVTYNIQEPEIGSLHS